MAQTRRTAPGAAMPNRSPVVGEPAIEDCADGDVMSPAAQAQGICLRLLTTRPRSRVELADALRQRGISAEIGESVLDRLGELGLVNDAALAEAAVHSGFSHRGLGRRALSTELRRRGVPDEVVREAVATVRPEDEAQRARELVRCRLRSIPVRATSTLARKLGAMLIRKGYPEGLAWRVVRDELGPGDWPDEIESCPD
jgi:regulatory protein